MKSTGTLRYSQSPLDPDRKSNWWLVLDCDDAIAKMYRHLYWLDCFKTKKLCRPAYSAHVTVVRDEEPCDDRKLLWDAHKGLELEFEYKGGVETNGDYHWLDVECECLLDIREELGLRREPIYPLHLSIGHEDKEVERRRKMGVLGRWCAPLAVNQSSLDTVGSIPIAPTLE